MNEAQKLSKIELSRAYNLAPLSLFILTALYSSVSFAENIVPAETKSTEKSSGSGVEFDATFLSIGNGNNVDLTRFADGANALPGEYNAGIYVNDILVLNDKIFIKSQENAATFPCITAGMLKKTNINFSKLPADTLLASDENSCIDIEEIIPGSRASFDSNEVRLNIQIPQLYMNRTARDYVDPSQWDTGVPVAFLNYDLSTYKSESNGEDYRSAYGLINSGVNIGAWYFRHNGSLTLDDSGEKSYSIINSYVQRDIAAIKGRLTIGQLNTQGEIFDTLPFSGVQLNSDDRMLPGSMQGYAPEIRGIARTTARVTVRQNGQTIYETTVSPGAFLINDLYPTGFGGNLQVTLREADGSEQYFEVPYASVAHLLRPGAQRYSAAIGQYRNTTLLDKPILYQGTYQRGLTNTFSAYGGLQANSKYLAVNTGLAIGTWLGAFSAGVTTAQTRLPDTAENHAGSSIIGQSYQVGYSKTISETDSNLALAAYRFSTSNYMDYQTAMLTRDTLRRGGSPDSIYRAKNRVTVTAGQGLPGEWGNFYLSASMQDYWNKEGNDETYQFGYNNRYKLLNYGISISRGRNGFGEFENTYLLSFTVPLGRNDITNAPQLRADLTQDSTGASSQQVNISGTAGHDSQFNYGVTTTNGNHGQGTNGSFNGGYRSPYTAISADYSFGRNYQSQGE